MVLLSSVPYFDASTKQARNEQLYTLSIHADMVKVRAMTPPTTPLKNQSSRGIVSGFSKRSRKRMIELLADEPRTPDLFVTLTFDDSYYDDWRMFFRQDFEAFRRRLERAYPNIACVWRLELENRKSGDYKGEIMPHFHIIVWLPDDMKNCASLIVDKDKNHHWSQWWHDITQCESEVHLKYRGCDISKIKSRRHAYHYVSKYAAKQSDDEIEIGRRWGRIGTVGEGSRADIIINKQEYIELKRLIASYWKRRKKHLSRLFKNMSPDRGLTLFGFALVTTPNYRPCETVIMGLLKHAQEIADQKRLL